MKSLPKKEANPSKIVLLRDSDGDVPTFDQVTQFAAKLNELREKWPRDNNDDLDGLILFSGDVFSSSVESMLTRGRNMVHLMNEVAPDVCTPGNHEFDFGIDQYKQLTGSCNFEWICSNIKERRPPSTPDGSTYGGLQPLLGTLEYTIFERSGLRIGMIGLLSRNSYESISPEARRAMELLDMNDACLALSEKLRQGINDERPCDLVFALTHADHSEDVELGLKLCAYSSENKPNLANCKGIDAIFGGHDHTYFLGEGVQRLNPDAVSRAPEKGDDGLLIVKSGSDFYDLSEVRIEVEDAPEGLARKKIVKSLQVIRHCIDALPGGDRRMRNVLKRQYRSEILKGLDTALVKFRTSVKVNMVEVRSKESAVGDWVADCILERVRHDVSKLSIDHSLPHGFIMGGGSIKGDFTIGPGNVTMRNVIDIVPYEGEVTLLKMKGKTIKTIFEHALAKLPSNDFPIFSGFRVRWDSTKDPLHRILQVHTADSGTLDSESEIADWKEYRIATNNFMAGVYLQRFGPNVQKLGFYKGPPMYRAIVDTLKVDPATILNHKLEQVRTQGYDTSVSFSGQIRDVIGNYLLDLNFQTEGKLREIDVNEQVGKPRLIDVSQES